MAEELGRLERPAAADYQSKRKLYLVTVFLAVKEMPPEFAERHDRYWRQVEEQIAGLEAKLGPVTRLYHEGVSEAGDAGLKLLEQMDPPAHKLAQSLSARGASLEALEDEEALRESLDWERMLLLGFMSQKAAQTVSQAYLDATRRRYEHMAKRLDETLKAPEAGVLFMREGHRLQFPNDLEVFVVSPPALDEIHRWLRERVEEKEEKPPAKA